MEKGYGFDDGIMRCGRFKHNEECELVVNVPKKDNVIMVVNVPLY